MRIRLTSLALLLAVTLASSPLLAHNVDAVSRAERAGRWLNLNDAQVQQLAHFITDVQLQRRQRGAVFGSQLIAVLTEPQKARLAELLVNRELNLPRGAQAADARLLRLQQALGLSAAQVANLRDRGENLRDQNQSLRQQRHLVAIVGETNADKIEQRIERRRSLHEEAH